MTSRLLDDLDVGSGYPHGSNLARKLKSSNGAPAREIARLYRAWREEAQSIRFDAARLERFVACQTKLFDGYRNSLDKPKFDQAFDSRGALQSSALEEFCRFLLEPVVREALDDEPTSVLLGHFNVYQGMFFTASAFKEFARLPTPHFPKVNMDFVIAKRVRIEASSAEETANLSDIYLPAVAIECKTYLDRTRYHGADGNATMVKGGFPGCLYILVSEMLKLDLEGVNVHGSRIDHIYVLRKTKNVDLKKRRAERISLKPIDEDAALDLLQRVREHLREDWSEPEAWEQTGRLK